MELSFVYFANIEIVKYVVPKHKCIVRKIEFIVLYKTKIKYILIIYCQYI